MQSITSKIQNNKQLNNEKFKFKKKIFQMTSNLIFHKEWSKNNKKKWHEVQLKV